MKTDAEWDELKQSIINFFRAMAMKGEYWFTYTNVTPAVAAAPQTVKEALRQMIFEGWLEIRDGDTRKEGLRYRLRAEYLK